MIEQQRPALHDDRASNCVLRRVRAWFELRSDPRVFYLHRIRLEPFGVCVRKELTPLHLLARSDSARERIEHQEPEDEEGCKRRVVPTRILRRNWRQRLLWPIWAVAVLRIVGVLGVAHR